MSSHGPDPITPEDIEHYLRTTFDDVDVVHTPDGAWSFFSCDPTTHWPNFATLGRDDDAYDHFSDLARPGLFRLNLGVGRTSFDAIAAADPSPDFRALDTLMPHPVYAAQRWVCIVSPSAETFERVITPLLEEAHSIVARRRRPAND